MCELPPFDETRTPQQVADDRTLIGTLFRAGSNLYDIAWELDASEDEIRTEIAAMGLTRHRMKSVKRIKPRDGCSGFDHRWRTVRKDQPESPVTVRYVDPESLRLAA